MRHSSFTAVYDACVLYPAPLRDFLIRLGLSGRFRARWSAQIHDEWKRNLLLHRPDLTAEQLNRTSALMDRAIPDALVTGHEELIVGLTLPDIDDRHVLAAAIRCNASVSGNSSKVLRWEWTSSLKRYFDRASSRRRNLSCYLSGDPLRKRARPNSSVSRVNHDRTSLPVADRTCDLPPFFHITFKPRPPQRRRIDLPAMIDGGAK